MRDASQGLVRVPNQTYPQLHASPRQIGEQRFVDDGLETRCQRRSRQFHLLRLWSADGAPLGWFVGDAGITCLAVLPGDVIVAGDAAGRVIFLRWLPPDKA